MNNQKDTENTSQIVITLGDCITVYQNGVTKYVCVWDYLPDICDTLGKALRHTLMDMKKRGMWRLECNLERR